MSQSRPTSAASACVLGGLLVLAWAGASPARAQDGSAEPSGGAESTEGEGAEPTEGREPTEGAEPTEGREPTEGAEPTEGREPTEAGLPDSAAEAGESGDGEPVVPEPPSDSERRRVGVILLATGELDQSVADGLTEALIGALAARGGVTLTGTTELQAQLGQEDEGTLECISSTTCIGRVGVELQLSEIIAGTLARRGERWVFHLDRIDTRSTRTLGRVYREVRGDLGVAADAISAAAAELFVSPVEPAVLSLRGPEGAQVSLDGVVVGAIVGGELRAEHITPGSHEVRIERRGGPPWVRVVRFVEGEQTHLEARLEGPTRVEESLHPMVWVAGATAVGAAVAGLALSILSQDVWEPTEQQRREGSVTRAELVSFYRARELEAIAAGVLFGVAGLAAAGSLLSLLFPERHEVELEVGLGTLGVRGQF